MNVFELAEMQGAEFFNTESWKPVGASQVRIGDEMSFPALKIISATIFEIDAWNIRVSDQQSPHGDCWVHVHPGYPPSLSRT